ncbi:MAG TPA: acyltransferase, partial [Micromonospora sp.]
MNGESSRSSESTTRPTPGTNLPSLTGLRWWLAIIVFGVHFSETANCMSASTDLPAACGVMNAGFGLGFVVMACFFVLSGFVLTWVAPPRETARRFWQRRFAKVYPLLLLGFVVDLVIRLLTGNVASVPVLLVNLFLLQTWWPDAFMALQVNPVAWSLSCEAFFYLCFPLIHGYLSRMGDRALRWLFVGLMFWPALMVLVASAAGSSDHGDLLYFFAPTRISEFVLGIIAGLLFRRGAWRGFRVGGVLALTVVAYFACFAVAIFLSPAAPALGAVLAPLFTLLIVSLARADATGGWSPMRGSFTMKMGM